jgi:hypothetical protein
MATTNFPTAAAAVILAQQQALRLIRRRIRSQGRVPLSTLSHARLTRMANDLVEAHPELIAEALELASELVPQQRPRKRSVSAGRTKAG